MNPSQTVTVLEVQVQVKNNHDHDPDEFEFESSFIDMSTDIVNVNVAISFQRIIAISRAKMSSV